ncbi:MAG: hypothetical protein LBE23_10100 [Vagococcus sp.]|jgi:hypothetical protein|nr:hypothetical protein [Vagococcus sp.]
MSFFRLKQLYKEKVLMFSFIILMIVSTAQVIDSLVAETLKQPGSYPTSLSYAWLLSNDGNSFFPFFFLFLILPLSSVSFSYHFSKELKSGYANYFIIRSNLFSYLKHMITINSFVSIFLIGVPLVWNVLLSSFFFPVLKSNELVDYMRKFPVTETETLNKILYQNHPLITIFMYILLAIVFTVAFNNFILLIGYFLNNSYVLFSLTVLIPLLGVVLPSPYTLSHLVFLMVVSNSINLFSFLYPLFFLFISSVFLLLLIMKTGGIQLNDSKLFFKKR